MKLIDWLRNLGASSWSDSLSPHLETEILKEVSSVSMDWDQYLHEVNVKAKFKAKYVFSFVVLKTGHAVGFNENPSFGWSFPISKYKNES